MSMRLSRTIIVRLTDGEHDAVSRLADEQCSSRAAVVRRAVRDHLARRHDQAQAAS